MMNQCDGCQAGIPVDEDGVHRVPYPSGSMKCEKEKYQDAPCPWDIDCACGMACRLCGTCQRGDRGQCICYAR